MRLLSGFVLLILCFCAASHAAERDAMLLRRILERYTESMGGTRQVEALASVSVEGTQIQNEKVYDFNLRKKRPDFIRFGLDSETCSIVCGYNGRVGWQRVINAAGEVDVSRLSADQLSVLLEEASFDSPLFRHLEKPRNKFTIIGNGVPVDEKLAYELELRESGVLTARYYLEMRSGRLLKREQIDVNGAVTLETLYRDYREVDGYWFAFEVENRADGERVSLVQIETILVNPGLLNFYFEMPSR